MVLNLKSFSLLTTMVLAVVASYSQDITNQNQFFFNPYTLNPSYAGTEGRPAFFLSYHKQWSGVSGAPTISNFSFHTSTKGKVSYGVNLNNDTRGIVKTSSALFTAGYTIPIDDFTWLRFGLSAGIGSNGVDVDKLGTFTDKILPSILNRNSFLMGNAGVSIHHKTFHGGLSLPNLFQPVYVSADPFSVTALRPFQQVIIHASNRFYFDNDKYVFEPYLMYRLNGSGIPSQLEVAGVLHLQHFVWVGGTYRQDFGISGVGGIKIQNQFALGLSYSIKNTGINELNSPSYEIQLAYLTGVKKKDHLAYSFMGTEKEKIHKKTAKEVADAKKKQDADLARKKEEDRKKQELILAKQAQDKKLQEDKKLAEEKRIQDEKNAQQPIVHQVDSSHHEDLKQLSRIAQHADDPNAEHGLSSDQHENHERHEVVKQGSHHEELDLGDYVVVGVFSNRGNAGRYAAELKKLNFNADFGFLTNHDKWYVFLFQGNDINQARAERDKDRKLRLFKDAWLLTVTP